MAFCPERLGQGRRMCCREWQGRPSTPEPRGWAGDAGRQQGELALLLCELPQLNECSALLVRCPGRPHRPATPPPTAAHALTAGS